MKRIVLMCGLPYAGKTTLAGHLAARLGAECVSADAIDAERGLGGAIDLPVEEWVRTHELALERALAALAETDAVVVDGAHAYRWQRDDYRRAAGAAGHAVDVVLVETPFEVVLERQGRAAAAGQKALPVELLVRLAQEFESPTPDEHPLRYTGDVPLEDWLAAQLTQPR